MALSVDGRSAILPVGFGDGFGEGFCQVRFRIGLCLPWLEGVEGLDVL